MKKTKSQVNPTLGMDSVGNGGLSALQVRVPQLLYGVDGTQYSGKCSNYSG